MTGGKLIPIDNFIRLSTTNSTIIPYDDRISKHKFKKIVEKFDENDGCNEYHICTCISYNADHAFSSDLADNNFRRIQLKLVAAGIRNIFAQIVLFAYYI